MTRAKSRSAAGAVQVDLGLARLSWDGPRATLLIDEVESSCVDVEDPRHLEFEYMQHLTCALDAAVPHGRPVRALHLGGAACALPWAWALHRPGSRQSVVEIDAALATLVRQWFDLPRAPELRIRVGDARAVLESVRAGSFEVIVRDAFAGAEVPEHLTTVECARAAERALCPGGLYMLNCAHGGGSDARIECASLQEVFGQVQAVADPKVGRQGRRGNVVLVAQKALAQGPGVDEGGAPSSSIGLLDTAALDRDLRRLPLPARLTQGVALVKWRAGARPRWDPPRP